MGRLDIVGELITSLGLGALIVLGYGFVLRHVRLPRRRTYASAVVFAGGAIAAMMNAIEMQSGYVFDTRAVFVVLSPVFGGPVAGLLVSAIVAAFRIWIGGDGVAAGVVGIAMAGAIGIGFALLGPKVQRFRSLLLLGCLSNLYVLSLLMAGFERAADLFAVIGAPLIVINTVGTVLLGSALESTRRATSYLHDVEFNADRDPLTGLHNRRALSQLEFTIEREAAAGEQKDGCVILFDIDRFKAVNDRYGHPRGDEVLKQVAKTIVTRIRRSDFAVRYGGEEIAIILLATTVDNGFRVAEQIRTTIEKLEFTFEGQTFSITISAGVAGFAAGETRLAVALDYADRALYRAKNAGRNRTEVLDLSSKKAERSDDEALQGDSI
ncbi:sensor domain-containing diguanylate cyclase [Martelella mediterranea]|uniref:diguanylate cyclase n=1 Tax=Martelella mediterranea DSM 17316 TaxID=1122214 RepID=A0A1U9Z560_9HYPH|nr:diguanylate cyclase [Martelella mediterranea]AQZ52811.1 Stalked cell differentiation-controlling protein [Martelella mediterranea DSM 17316]